MSFDVRASVRERDDSWIVWSQVCDCFVMRSICLLWLPDGAFICPRVRWAVSLSRCVIGVGS